jgi:uncharacterized membrane protein
MIRYLVQALSFVSMGALVCFFVSAALFAVGVENDGRLSSCERSWHMVMLGSLIVAGTCAMISGPCLLAFKRRGE